MFRLSNLTLFILAPCLLLSLFNQACAATCISTGNGNWATGATWSCGSVPTCGDSVVIQAGHTVTISSQQDLRGCGSLLRLAVYGTLRFTTGNKLRLACNSRVYVLTGGSLVPGGGGGSSNELEICGATMWQASDGTYTGPGCFPGTLTACPAVLPVELSWFKQVVCPTEKGVCFAWETKSEKNNSHFELERSFDGIEFEFIENVPSSAPGGNSSISLGYTASDKAAPSGKFYYRLRQFDFDGKNKTSGIILTEIEDGGKLNVSVLPNPSNGNFSINFKNHSKIKKQSVLIEIRNTSGITVFKQKSIVDDSGIIEISFEDKAEPGIYYCTIQSKETSNKLKLIFAQP